MPPPPSNEGHGWNENIKKDRRLPSIALFRISAWWKYDYKICTQRQKSNHCFDFLKFSFEAFMVSKKIASQPSQNL